jgi:hypothetical protein
MCMGRSGPCPSGVEHVRGQVGTLSGDEGDEGDEGRLDRPKTAGQRGGGGGGGGLGGSVAGAGEPPRVAWSADVAVGGSAGCPEEVCGLHGGSMTAV